MKTQSMGSKKMSRRQKVGWAFLLLLAWPAYEHFQEDLEVLTPTLEISEVCDSGSTFLEPLNIMCSNRCAKPVRPLRSFLDPT